MSVSKLTFNEKIDDFDFIKIKKKKKQSRENEDDEEEIEQEEEEVIMEDLKISLPIELFLEFLSRLPVKSLTRLSCTSKYLYNHINHNHDFTKSHMINYSRKNPQIVLYISIVTNEGQWLLKSLFHVRDQHDEKDNYCVDLWKTFTLVETGEFVGYCNGLNCYKLNIGGGGHLIDVWNYTTRELLRIVPPVLTSRYKLMSCAFGFDYIHNVYKLVLIVYMVETKSLKCLVYTFGIKSSWGEVSFPDSRLLVISSVATFTPYGASGGGEALFWWTSDPHDILMFDLHGEKLQYIRIPAESNDDARLFEYKGFLAVAILQKKESAAPTLEKVHLKILEAYKGGQVWVEQTIDLSTYSIPFSDNFRFVSFHDQILLYWVEHRCFQFFNLHLKCLKVIKNLGGSDKRLLPAVGTGDYWLNSEVKNICSLKTLLPERAYKSDRATYKLMAETFDNTGTLPSTVGGFFFSRYRSKTDDYYFFDR